MSIDAAPATPPAVAPLPALTRATRLMSLIRVRHPSSVLRTDIATRETTLRVALRSFFVVVLFWWSATGVVFALERTPATRLLGLLVATAMAVWGASLVYFERDRGTPSAARRSFLGGASLWTWIQVCFYGGWLVGPPSLMHPIPAESPSFSLAVRAVQSMLWYELGMLAVLATAWLLTRGSTNRVGWHTLALFWLVHQTASVAIFLGVENPGRGFFPDPLTYLESYFGPQRNSLFLPLSIALVLGYTLFTAIYAIRDQQPARRQARMLLVVIGALSVFELAVLGTPINVPFWQAFLDVRGY
jgi:putative photosynthetic complex assembly protein 2